MGLTVKFFSRWLFLSLSCCFDRRQRGIHRLNKCCGSRSLLKLYIGTLVLEAHLEMARSLVLLHLCWYVGPDLIRVPLVVEIYIVDRYEVVIRLHPAPSVLL